MQGMPYPVIMQKAAYASPTARNTAYPMISFFSLCFLAVCNFVEFILHKSVGYDSQSENTENQVYDAAVFFAGQSAYGFCLLDFSACLIHPDQKIYVAGYEAQKEYHSARCIIFMSRCGVYVIDKTYKPVYSVNTAGNDRQQNACGEVAFLNTRMHRRVIGVIEIAVLVVEILVIVIILIVKILVAVVLVIVVILISVRVISVVCISVPIIEILMIVCLLLTVQGRAAVTAEFLAFFYFFSAIGTKHNKYLESVYITKVYIMKIIYYAGLFVNIFLTFINIYT